MKVISYSCSNIDSEDEIEGEDAYLNADIDFDDDGWEEIIETWSSSCPSSDATVAYKQTEPTTTKRKIVYLLVTI